jgi:mannose/cellobiose epimerase-like protein (N-acyl-D-glucosamine 2-epimerase family)
MSEDSIKDSVSGLREWVQSEALPLWGGVGFDAASSTFIERLDPQGSPLLLVPRRIMVQARQIYVFSHAALLGWWPAGAEIATLAAHAMVNAGFETDGAPGWIFSIDCHANPIDRKRELYTQAFALYGLAWAYKAAPNPTFLDVAYATVATLERFFASPTGGYFTALPADVNRRDQNPHMHLFEAFIAWHDATGDSRFLARAAQIYSMMAARFFQPDRGVLPEYFDASWTPCRGATGRICEPGHHYEWFWLLRNYARRIGMEHEPISKSLKLFADRYGGDAENLIVDELLDDGTVNKASRRCWPHTEKIKAEVAAFEEGESLASLRAARTISRLRSVFLGRPKPPLWVDHIGPNGHPLVEYVPASTLYHVFLATAEAHRVWG